MASVHTSYLPKKQMLISCPTEEVAEKVIEILLEKYGYTLGVNRDNIHWKSFKENTCYSTYDNCIVYRSIVMSHNVRDTTTGEIIPITSSSRFLGEHGITSIGSIFDALDLLEKKYQGK